MIEMQKNNVCLWSEGLWIKDCHEWCEATYLCIRIACGFSLTINEHNH